MSDSVTKFMETRKFDGIIYPVKDPVVESVVSKFRERSNVGIKKYGTTLQGSNEDVLAFINHAQEEAMDQILYLEKLKSFYK